MSVQTSVSSSHRAADAGRGLLALLGVVALVAGVPLVLVGWVGSPLPAGASLPTYEVQRRDTLWDIAERHLGDPLRWPEIFRLNEGCPQADGRCRRRCCPQRRHRRRGGRARPTRRPRLTGAQPTMASTTLPPRGQAQRPAPPAVAGGRRQRRWSLAMVAVLVTLGSALAFVVLWMNAGGREPVLALRDDVAAGQIIEADDLAVVRVSADDGIAPIPSSRRDEVIGQPAATNLLAGMLLVPNAVGTAHGLERGTAVIAVPVPISRLPTSDLRTGDRVVIVRTESPGQDDGGSRRTIGEGRVFEVQDANDAGTEVRVSVTVHDSLAPDIASAVAEDEIFLFMTAGG